MENILMFITNNPNIIYLILGIAIILFIISLCKKAISLAIGIFILGAALAVVKPIGTQIMADNGITVNGSQINIRLENGETKTIDISTVNAFTSNKNEDGTYTVTLKLNDDTSTSFIVSEQSAKWIKSCLNIVGEIKQAGANFVTNWN